MREVLLCPITHSPPVNERSAVEIPARVARHLALDSDRSWIKTDQVNTVVWPKGRLPYGVVPLANREWSYGQLPRALGELVLNQVLEHSQRRALGNVLRDDEGESR